MSLPFEVDDSSLSKPLEAWCCQQCGGCNVRVVDGQFYCVNCNHRSGVPGKRVFETRDAFKAWVKENEDRRKEMGL